MGWGWMLCDRGRCKAGVAARRGLVVFVALPVVCGATGYPPLHLAQQSILRRNPFFQHRPFQLFVATVPILFTSASDALSPPDGQASVVCVVEVDGTALAGSWSDTSEERGRCGVRVRPARDSGVCRNAEARWKNLRRAVERIVKGEYGEYCEEEWESRTERERTFDLTVLTLSAPLGFRVAGGQGVAGAAEVLERFTCQRSKDDAA